MEITSTNTNNSSFFNKATTVDKVKSNDFETFMALKKISTQTSTTNENKTVAVKEKDLTQKLYDEIIFLLKTNISNEELKLIKERLEQIQKMKEDGKSDDEIKAALKQLAMEIEEIRKNRINTVVEKTSDNTNTADKISDSNKIITNIKNMFQEIQDSLKNKKETKMEITTNSSIYTAVSTSQTTSNTNTQNKSSSFNTLVNTQEQETIPISKMARTPKIVEFLDRYNKFSTLSPTDEKIFRDILSDNKLTKEEADSLSYEQVERISNLLTTNLPLNKEEFDAMPIVQMGVDLFATRLTGNRQFNEAYYNTMKELPDEQKHVLESEVNNNLGQLYLGRKLEATFSYGDSYLANPWEYENMNADFGKFIKDVINHHEAIINNPKVVDVIKPQFQKIVDVYKVLEKNYNQVINKTKYA